MLQRENSLLQDERDHPVTTKNVVVPAAAAIASIARSVKVSTASRPLSVMPVRQRVVQGQAMNDISVSVRPVRRSDVSEAAHPPTSGPVRLQRRAPLPTAQPFDIVPATAAVAPKHGRRDSAPTGAPLGGRRPLVNVHVNDPQPGRNNRAVGSMKRIATRKEDSREEQSAAQVDYKNYKDVSGGGAASRLRYVQYACSRMYTVSYDSMMLLIVEVKLIVVLWGWYCSWLVPPSLYVCVWW